MGNLSLIDGLPVRKSGDWAERKHHYLNNYCGITTVSMRKKIQAGLCGCHGRTGPLPD
jgi:hypothetical protein